jgi:phosphotransacetylase
VRALAKADAYGVVLQGFRLPICDLSRGASVGEIVGVSIMASALASAHSTDRALAMQERRS